METKIIETIQRIQAASGNTACPGVKKTKEGYEFTLELPREKEAALVLYVKEKKETRSIEIPFSEESRRGNLVSLLEKDFQKEKCAITTALTGKSNRMLMPRP